MKLGMRIWSHCMASLFNTPMWPLRVATRISLAQRNRRVGLQIVQHVPPLLSHTKRDTKPLLSFIASCGSGINASECCYPCAGARMDFPLVGGHPGQLHAGSRTWPLTMKVVLKHEWIVPSLSSSMLRLALQRLGGSKCAVIEMGLCHGRC